MIETDTAVLFEPALADLCRGGVDRAVDKAIHDLDPETFHDKRLSPGACPLCPNFWDQVKAVAESAMGPVRDKLLRAMADETLAQMEDE